MFLEDIDKLAPRLHSHFEEQDGPQNPDGQAAKIPIFFSYIDFSEFKPIEHVGPPKPELHVQLFGAVQIPL
ncbi:hypothetical protein WUBG_17451 [Wuchereria bancrofti]|uniref:Uncharacterized protein n=1 Tax=Wuchereria bancrofti TaxID=6293 RepID=J9DPS8_WUCBA|nr:hypothetical protein WUBG_17451 [Wuchereria bancrofti]